MRWPPPRRPLEGAIVRLEPLEAGHRDGLRRAAEDEETCAWLDPRVPRDAMAFHGWFEARLIASRDAEEWCFATCSVADGAPIGSSSYLNVRTEHDGLEIGWTWLRPSAWRTGANLEAKLLMLAQAFDELGCMRVRFKTDARNERSRAALAALPATFGGVLRKHMRTPMVGVRDSAYYSIVDDEWAEVRKNLLDRLRRGAEAGAHA
jgi:RimJ/RimL family protein N-acetyltransferase